MGRTGRSFGHPNQRPDQSEHPDFIKLYGKDNDLEGDDDWIKVLQKNPSVVTQPILVNGNKAMQVNTPSDVMVFLDEES